MSNQINISALGHTWILDLDGTLVKHNGYKIDGFDTLLPEALNFMYGIPENDMIIIVTSREEQYRDITTDFLHENNIKYDYIIFGAPYGERILLNDMKPAGLKTSIAVNLERDTTKYPTFTRDETM